MRLQPLWQELRFAARVLAKNPGATALSIVSIALGIGLTSSMFSVGDALLLRPFALDHPEELFYATSRGEDGQVLQYGWPDYEDMGRAAAGLAELSAYTRRGVMLIQDNDTEFIFAYAASPNYFSVAGVKAAAGQASLEPSGGRPAAILGSRLWQRRFGGDPHVVGKTIILNGKPFLVTGVMPPEFTGMVKVVVNDVWVSTDAWFDVFGSRHDRQSRNGQFEIVARLKPGVTPESLAAKLDAAIRGPGKHKPAPPRALATLLQATFAPGWRTSLIAGGGLLAVLGLVLFVACANVAQLRLAQAEARKKELGLRMALGAGPWCIVRCLLAETGLIALAGAGFGVLITRLLMGKVSEFLSAGRVFIDYGIRLDHRVLAFTITATVFSVLLSGLLPAQRALRLNIAQILKSEQGATGARTGWQSKVLIIGQVAVSVALFGAAALFIESLLHATAVRPGLDPDKKLFIMNVAPSWRSQTVMWCEQACERLSGLPGVRAATFARRLPLAGSGGGATVRVEIPGQAPLGVRFNNVGGNYFSIMGTRVIVGRGIDASDRQGSPLTVVVSQQFARRFFNGRNPLGEWISVEGKQRQVAGVAEDGPSNDVHEDPEPFLYLPFAQQPSGEVTVMVETAGDPGLLAQTIRRELKRFDPRAVIFSSTTLREHMAQALSGDRMMATLATGLGIFAIVLTSAGLFGVLQYTISRRTRELGLRLALGALPSDIQKMVLAESLRMTAWGIPIGLALLVGIARSVRSLVLGVTPLDPLAYVSGVAVALVIASAATWLPARRATRVDPITALRAE